MEQDIIRQMIGKTVESVEGDTNSLEIFFTDGSKIEVVGRGSDEGFYLIVRD